ncbi:RagB/SusD family nutrient uptake outer membrane protein [Arcticibacterium luteifluviistationis]|uniref:RagB/SusD family nutrient uptake outer membrane protein n=1 Tax=Arcticibacterium luteifluviistationis TaxID=1784714 RepID=A0A2Z4G6G7_9BACT|nr:RagB/SusD family nutrient uptake outer membrane protein [Arcticibacterium luteifluviistationis]AWV96736.1 hypothetical protein DJ013_00420 [Arcticibacterium luteifluviistationis]
MKNILNNKSRSRFGISTLLVVGSAWIFSSCLDLQEDPGVARLAPGSYSNQAELELGVTGLYSQLETMAQWSTFQVAGWGGDDITTHRASNKADFREYDQRAVSPLNARSASNWRDIYAVVRAANSVLANSAELELPNKDVQDALIGEAYFIRGFMFYHLTRIHGEIPLHLDINPQVDLSKSSQVEVYQQIEKDFKQAEAFLPNLYAGVSKGAPRPNKGSATAFLARLYLDWAGYPVKDQSKYALAASSAKSVMDNANSHGFALVQDFESLWTVGNRFNDESLFTVAYSVANGLSNRKYGKLGHPSDKLGWQETFAEIKYFEDMPEGVRKEATYRTDYNWEDFTDQANPVFLKIVGPEGDISLDDFNTDRNDYMMRYAEVLLIYAEAQARAGAANDDAWEALNKIRRRAAGLPFGTPDASVDLNSGDLAELVFTERKWEFAGEWLRWNDLVRLERVEEALSQRGNVKSKTSAGVQLAEPNAIIGSLGLDNYFAPIPQNEIELNPNLK